MRQLYLIILSLSISFITSCEKMEYNTPKSEGKISEVLNEENKTIGKFIYDKNGFVKESWFEEDIFSPDEKAEYSYQYDSNNRLLKKSGYEPGIIYMSSFQGHLGKDVDYSYKYNSKGNLVEMIVDLDYDDKYNIDFSTQITFQYPEKYIVMLIRTIENSDDYCLEYQFNSKGNIEKEINYYMVPTKEKRVISETTFTYDTKNAPYRVEPLPSSKNNILKKTITVYNYDNAGNKSIAYTSIYTYKYTYNDDNYPISQVETMPNKIEKIRYFKF